MPLSKTAAFDSDVQSGQVDRRSDYSASCCSPSAAKKGDVKIHVSNAFQLGMFLAIQFKGTSRQGISATQAYLELRLTLR